MLHIWVEQGKSGRLCWDPTYMALLEITVTKFQWQLQIFVLFSLNSIVWDVFLAVHLEKSVQVMHVNMHSYFEIYKYFHLSVFLVFVFHQTKTYEKKFWLGIYND